MPFVILWNSRRFVDNDYFTFVGISLLFFAFLDFMHLLGNKNMGVFPGYGNLGPTFYIASRYVLSISLLTAPLFIKRKLNTTLDVRPVFGGYVAHPALRLLLEGIPGLHRRGGGPDAFQGRQRLYHLPDPDWGLQDCCSSTANPSIRGC